MGSPTLQANSLSAELPGNREAQELCITPEKPGGPQAMGSHRVGHDLAAAAPLFYFYLKILLCYNISYYLTVCFMPYLHQTVKFKSTGIFLICLFSAVFPL